MKNQKPAGYHKVATQNWSIPSIESEILKDINILETYFFAFCFDKWPNKQFYLPAFQDIFVEIFEKIKLSSSKIGP